MAIALRVVRLLAQHRAALTTTGVGGVAPAAAGACGGSSGASQYAKSAIRLRTRGGGSLRAALTISGDVRSPRARAGLPIST